MLDQSLPYGHRDDRRRGSDHDVLVAHDVTLDDLARRITAVEAMQSKILLAAVSGLVATIGHLILTLVKH